MGNEAIALNRKALPIGVFKNISARLTAQSHGAVGATAVDHQDLIGKHCTGQTSLNAVRFVFGQDRNGQRGHRHEGMGESVAVTDCLARFQLVNRAAVGTLGMAFTGHVQVNLGVRVPDLHVSLGAGAKNTTLWV